MKLTRDQLRGPWTEGLIIGFINKRQAEEKLLQCPPGTFLLRFSDSELGIVLSVNKFNESKLLRMFSFQVVLQLLGLKIIQHQQLLCCNHFVVKILEFDHSEIASKIYLNV